MKPSCYTVGHSNYDAAVFMDVLAYYGITLVVDVRSVPYSRFVPQYNREVLTSNLKQHGIKYQYAGNELGGRRDCRDLDGVVRTENFQKGLDSVLAEIVRGEKVALMCAEKDPFDCHRFYLITYALEKQGVEVRHILENGNSIQTEVLEDKLVEVYHDGLFQLSLFEETDSRDVTRRAYSRRFQEISSQLG